VLAQPQLVGRVGAARLGEGAHRLDGGRVSHAPQRADDQSTTLTIGCVDSVRYSSSSCSRLVALTVIVTPRYLAPLLGRSSVVAASNVGSNRRAISVTAWTKPSTLVPITLIGNRDGYSISDCSAGMSCMRVSIATTS